MGPRRRTRRRTKRYYSVRRVKPPRGTLRPLTGAEAARLEETLARISQPPMT